MPCKSNQKVKDRDDVLRVNRLNAPTSLINVSMYLYLYLYLYLYFYLYLYLYLYRENGLSWSIVGGVIKLRRVCFGLWDPRESCSSVSLWVLGGTSHLNTHKHKKHKYKHKIQIQTQNTWELLIRLTLESLGRETSSIQLFVHCTLHRLWKKDLKCWKMAYKHNKLKQ